MSWTNYKNLQVPSASTGQAGINLTSNLVLLAQEAPYNATGDPTTTNGSTEGFVAGSKWYNISSQTLWICLNTSSTTPEWVSLYQRVAGAIVLAPTAGVNLSENPRLQLGPGGNTRGTASVDLQSIRSAAYQVASGPESVIVGGINNEASLNTCTVVGGDTNTASAIYATVVGGRHNTASGPSSHAEGYYTSAAGSGAHSEGDHSSASGNISHAEGLYASASVNGAHAEGSYTTASGLYSHAEGGSTTASGKYAHAEGNYTTASAASAHAGGNRSHAHLIGQWARAAGGQSSGVGTAQTTITQLFGITVGNTSTVLTLDGNTPASGNTFTVISDQTLSCFVNIVGRKEGGSGSDNGSFLRQVLICFNSTTQIVGTVQSISPDINPAAWGSGTPIAIDADTSNNALRITVTGAAGATIRWTATVLASEAADAAF